MKRIEKTPSDEIVLEALLNDEIERNSDVFHFIKILDNVEEGITIAIDGKWGTGKTFFVKQIKLVLDAYNDQTSMEEEKRRAIKDYCSKLLKDKAISDTPKACIYYDAWEHDDYEDPLLSIIYEMISAVGRDKSALNNTDLLEAALSIVDVVTNRNISGIRNTFKKTDPLKEIKEKKDLHDLIKTFLDEITDEWGNNLVVFIDELDRCNPLFAVKLLERIKHYFYSEKVTFVFSINLIELQHTIHSVYGEKFNASQYLNRFFDIICGMSDVSVDVFGKSIKAAMSDISRAVCQHFDFSLRDQAQFYQMINICGLGRQFKQIPGVESFIQKTILPIMIGLRIFDYNQYNHFVSLGDSSIVTEIISKVSYNKWIVEAFFESGTKATWKADDESQNMKIIENGFERLCKAIFRLEGFGNDYYQTIGQIGVYKETKSNLMKEINSMSSSIILE